jgi:hypothetical protein
MFFGSIMRVPVPVAVQFIACKNALTVVDERQAGGIEPVVAINLDE